MRVEGCVWTPLPYIMIGRNLAVLIRVVRPRGYPHREVGVLAVARETAQRGAWFRV